MPDFFQFRQLFFDLRHGIANGQAFPEQNLVSLAHRTLGLFGNAIAFHADFVDGARLRRITIRHHKWRHVLHHLRATANHRHFADPAKLVDGRQPAYHRVILHHHVARQRRHVRHDDVVAEHAIVRDVAVGQNVIVRADARDLAVTGRAVNRDIFAERVVIADFHARDAALPFQILRLQPEAREWKNFIPLSQLRVSVNDDVRMQLAAGGQGDMFPDDTIRTDVTTGVDFRPGMNDGSRMDHGNIYDLRFMIYDLDPGSRVPTNRKS